MATPDSWNLVSESLHADCRVFKVYRQLFQHPRDNREGVFFAVRCADWVLTLPVTTDGRLVLVRQFRIGTQALSWEPPGGLMEAGEDPVQAGRRELEEETGFVGESACVIGDCAPNPAIFSNTAHFVLVENCQPSGRVNWDDNEEVEVGLFSVREVEAMIQHGKMRHVIAQAALYRLRLSRPDLWDEGIPTP